MIRRLRTRLRDEAGMGIIELVAAMAILSIAVSALLGVFVASALSVTRSSIAGTALTVADRQMETYRTMPYACIPVTTSGTLTRPVLSPDTCPATPASFPNPYGASQTIVGSSSPDHRAYVVQTTITAVGSAQKQVAVTVRQGTATSPVSAQATSYFSAAGFSN